MRKPVTDRGMRTADGVAACDAVISTMNTVRTYRELVGGAPGRACARKNPAPSRSGMVLHLGPDRRDGHLERRTDGPPFQGYRRTMPDTLERTGGMPDLEERIVVEHRLTPADICARDTMLDGAIYGSASHGPLTGAFEPGNRSRAVRGLYRAGGAAHPGPGMPTVMMSGRIAAGALDRDHRGALSEAAA